MKLGLKKGADCKRNTEEEEFVLRLVVLVLFPTNLKFPWRPLSSILLAEVSDPKYAENMNTFSETISHSLAMVENEISD